MYRPLGPATLRTGEVVETAVVRGPDSEWAERIEDMLRHKGDPWNWQNSESLRDRCGLSVDFFIAHRGGVPFANIMLAETGGVALLGHVWTDPAARRGGASSILMERVLQEFRPRGGQAIFLGTDFDSAAWHFYRRRGFEPVEPRSGFMAWHRTSASDFEGEWFQAKEAVVEPLDWPHWVAAAPLCLGAFPGTVRLAAARLCGRRSSEESLLPLIRENRRSIHTGEPIRAIALRDARGPAVLGLACRVPHPLWPDRDILDVFCHPRWWHRAGELLAGLPAGSAERTVAYADRTHLPKLAALTDAGLRLSAVLPCRIHAAPGEAARTEVALLDCERET